MNSVPGDARTIVARSYFCGRRHHDAGPYAFHLRAGRVAAITALDAPGPDGTRAGAGSHESVAFLMPGLVEAHCHLFRDGAVPGRAAQTAGRDAGQERLLAVAEANVRLAYAAGITLIRDAGDRHGINHRMRARSRAECGVVIRSPGPAICRQGAYGRFMGTEVATREEALAAVERLAPGADDLKIILTGIVDFARMAVTAGPQFDAATLRGMVARAHHHGCPVFVHCSGLEGIEAAIAAGVDSIEHGYFMTGEALQAMADRGIAWVPTLAPLQFQWAHPAVAGWPAPVVANLRRILDAQLAHIELAGRLGVRLIAGSDAGSPGVVHGQGLLAELELLREAGLSLVQVLAAATAVPREHWGCAWPELRSGCPAAFVVADASPFDNPAWGGNLRVFGPAP
ncbi:MAG: amidohydrolase family protein [Gammaproteobacteria bacterium]|nr:amidohydrolase family protein [Gammaproteobacteria bacterium]